MLHVTTRTTTVQQTLQLQSGGWSARPSSISYGSNLIGLFSLSHKDLTNSSHDDKKVAKWDCICFNFSHYWMIGNIFLNCCELLKIIMQKSRHFSHWTWFDSISFGINHLHKMEVIKNTCWFTFESSVVLLVNLDQLFTFTSTIHHEAIVTAVVRVPSN